MDSLDQLAALQVLYLTTTGRISGEPRTIEIWFVAHQRYLYLLAEHYQQAHWVKNIMNNPMVHVRIGGKDMDARARILELGLDAELWRTVQGLARKKYGWGAGLPVQLTPI